MEGSYYRGSYESRNDCAQKKLCRISRDFFRSAGVYSTFPIRNHVIFTLERLSPVVIEKERPLLFFWEPEKPFNQGRPLVDSTLVMRGNSAAQPEKRTPLKGPGDPELILCHQCRRPGVKKQFALIVSRQILIEKRCRTRALPPSSRGDVIYVSSFFFLVHGLGRSNRTARLAGSN